MRKAFVINDQNKIIAWFTEENQRGSFLYKGFVYFISENEKPSPEEIEFSVKGVIRRTECMFG